MPAAAFWFFLDAFRVGGSVQNVMLVFGVNAVAGADAVDPRWRRHPAGAARAGVREQGTSRRRGRLLGRPADRDRRVHGRLGLFAVIVHLPLPLLQGGDPRGPASRERQRARRRREAPAREPIADAATEPLRQRARY